MIPSLNTLITILIPATASLILFMFLPAIVELKKPKDAGPRLIDGSFAQIRFSSLTMPLLNLEDDLKLDSQLNGNIWGSFLFISNLEA
jgi:hypothetical protein